MLPENRPELPVADHDDNYDKLKYVVLASSAVALMGLVYAVVRVKNAVEIGTKKVFSPTLVPIEQPVVQAPDRLSILEEHVA